MLIDCPSCARSYNVSRADIGEEGRTVICPRCEARWFVDSDGTGTLIPPPEPIRTTAVSGRGPIIEHETEATPRPSAWRRMRSAACAALCLLTTMGLLAARERIVRAAPRTAGLYAAIGLPVNLRGLQIAALAPARMDDASSVTIAGEIRNVAQKRVGIPRLTYQVRDASGAMLVTWTERAAARTLATGKSLPFVSSPHRLPADAHSILVRFEDEDAATPIRLARRSAD